MIGVEEANARPVLPPKGGEPKRVESMQQELLRLGHQAIQPPFHPISASYTVDGRTVVVVWAPRQPGRGPDRYRAAAYEESP